jgi:hypothetical protein
MAPNAIIGLIQCTNEISARISKRESLPPAYMMKTMNGVAGAVVGIG